MSNFIKTKRVILRKNFTGSFILRQPQDVLIYDLFATFT